MNFYEYIGEKSCTLWFGNRTLTYVLTEGELAVKEFEQGQVKKKGKQAETEITTSESAVKKQEEFEEMKKKTRNMLLIRQCTKKGTCQKQIP